MEPGMIQRGNVDRRSHDRHNDDRHNDDRRNGHGRDSDRPNDRRRRAWQVSIWTAVAAAVMLTSSAWAQMALEGDNAFTSSTEVHDAPAMLSDQFIILAKHALAGEGEIRPDQFASAQIMLDLASQLSPDDPEIHRLKMELAEQTQDQQAYLTSLTRYASLVPEDDQAQWRLTQHRLSQLQTLDARVAAAQRMLNSPRAARLSDALRSRLGSFIAAGAREIDDMTTFKRWLGDALKRDRANARATELTYDLILQREGSDRQVGLTLASHVRAAPRDAQARVLMARFLLQQRAFEQAAGQFQAAQFLAQRPLPPEFHHAWLFSLVAAGQADQAEQLFGKLEQFYAAMRQQASGQAQDQGEQANPADPPGDAAVKVDPLVQPNRPAAGGEVEAAEAIEPSIALPVELELLRLAIYRQSGRTDQAKGAFKRVADQLTRFGKSSEAVAQDVHWLSLLFDLPVPAGIANEQAAPAPLSPEDADADRLKGYRAWREGDLPQARKVLEPLAESDPFACYALAQIETAGDGKTREHWLEQTIELGPGSIPALMAIMDLQARNQLPQPTPAGQQVSRFLSTLSSTVSEPAPDKPSWTGLKVSVSRSRFTYLEPITLEVSIRNSTNQPMSLGPGGSLPSRVMMLVRLSVRGSAVGAPFPVVVDLHRRLRLEPRESLTVEVRLDRAPLGLILSDNPTQAFSFSVKAILDPRMLRSNRLAPSPFGSSDTLNLFTRLATPPTEQVIQANFDAMEAGNPTEQLRALAWAGVSAKSMSDSDDQQTVATGAQLAQKINQLYRHLSPVAQAWTLRFVPTEALFSQVFDQARRSDDPATRVMYLAMHVTDAASPDLNDALRHENETIRQFAQALRQRIAAGDTGRPEASATDQVSPDADVFDP